MKIFSILFVTIFLLGACSSTPEPEGQKVKPPIKTEFLGGGLTIAYDEDGAFKSITSVSTSKVTSKLPSAVEGALKIATLKARRQIAEFINTEVQSDRFTSSILDSLQAAQTLNDDTTSKLRNTIALKVRENITQKSSQILKGTFVQSEKHDTEKGQVIVTVMTGVGSVDTSNQLKKLMSQ